MPLQATSGAASYDAFGGGGAAVEPNYIESVFSTWLYTGTGASQTITNGIDLSTKGGLVWIKGRNTTALHGLVDTVRGVNSCLVSSSAAGPNDLASSGISSFSSTGFVLNTSADFNGNTNTQASWTFRKQTKFFDVVTYTGNATSGRTVNHNLGSIPACIIVKNLSRSTAWSVYHRGVNGGVNPQNYYLSLNTTDAQVAASSEWNNTAPTSTQFTIGNGSNVNNSAENYVAYLFAHDAGGFGLTGTDNVISCGSFTETGTVYPTATVSLGWEPQFIFAKPTNTAGDWFVVDTMRKLPAPTGTCTYLLPNSSQADATAVFFNVNATGFTVHPVFGNGTTYIYIAIRRGPMKVPTLGTSVFSPITSAASTGTTLTTDFPVDLQILKSREAVDATYLVDRLRGVNTTGVTGSSVPYLTGNTTAAEVVSTTLAASNLWNNTSFKMPSGFGTLSSVFWSFRRAPSFFDVVCYTGTGSYAAQTHNLGVAPELVITKTRSTTSPWYVVRPNPIGKYMSLNTTAAEASINFPATSTTVGVIDDTLGSTYVYYLFATLAGVSKVGSYTGTATTKQIDCGFTAGARFVLIKKTSGTGSWYVWDSARGIVSGNDPYLLLNSTAAEVTNTDYIDTYSAGFEISSTAPSEINENGGSFIFLAIS